MALLDWSQCPAVESIPGKVSGTWVLRNTRMPVATIFENLEAGADIDDISQTCRPERTLNLYPTATSTLVMKTSLCKRRPTSVASAHPQARPAARLIRQCTVGGQGLFGDAPVVLTGRTPSDQRQGLVDRFRNDPHVRVFLANILAAASA